MPRHDDRYSNTRLYVGRLSSRTRSRDLESIFSRYGRVRDVDMKYDYAFVEFSDARDADDAQYGLNGRDIDGSRIIVEFAKGIPRGSGSSSREYLGRGPPPGTGRCFNCGIDGHWARDCKAGDWKNKCYRCGDRGHIERNCQNSPKKLKKDRNYSLSPVRRSRSPRRGRSGRSRSPSHERGRSRSPSHERGRSRSPSHERGRSRSPSHERGRSYSRSRSPPKRERAVEKKRLRSYSRSPTPKDLSPPPTKTRKVVRSPSPSPSRSPRDEISPSHNGGQDKSEYGESPRGKSRSRSRSPEKRDVSLPPGGRYESPSEANGRGRRSPSPIDEEDDPRSPRGSESP